MPLPVPLPAWLVALFSRRMVVPLGETRSIEISFREPWARLTTALRLSTVKFGSVMFTASGNEVTTGMFGLLVTAIAWAIPAMVGVPGGGFGTTSVAVPPLAPVKLLAWKSAALTPSVTRLASIRSTGGLAPGCRPPAVSSQSTETWPPGTAAPPATVGSDGRPWLITIWGEALRSVPVVFPAVLTSAGGANVLPPSLEPVSSMTLGLPLLTFPVLLLVLQAT